MNLRSSSHAFYTHFLGRVQQVCCSLPIASEAFSAAASILKLKNCDWSKMECRKERGFNSEILERKTTRVSNKPSDKSIGHETYHLSYKVTLSHHKVADKVGCAAFWNCHLKFEWHNFLAILLPNKKSIMRQIELWKRRWVLRAMTVGTTVFISW